MLVIFQMMFHIQLQTLELHLRNCDPIHVVLKRNSLPKRTKDVQNDPYQFVGQR